MHVRSERVLRLQEWHSGYDHAFHGIHNHVPTLIHNGAPIAYTIGTRKADMEVHLINAIFDIDDSPFWVVETLIDIKFLHLKALPFIKKSSLYSISAQDRCPQLDAYSKEMLFPPLMYHVKDVHSAIVIDAWITDTQFQKLSNLDQLKYCVALSRQSLVSIYLVACRFLL